MPPLFIFVLLVQAAAAATEDSTIHISLSVTALVSLGLVVFREFRPKSNGVGSSELLKEIRDELKSMNRGMTELLVRDRDRARGAAN